MDTPHYDMNNIADEFIWRLANDHIKLYDLALANKDLFELEVTDHTKEAPYPPNAYKVKYTFESIVGIDKEKKPIYGKDHLASIELSKDYPFQVPDCKMLTTVWHPNIRFEGLYKGTICLRLEEAGSLMSLDELVILIGQYLQYQKYLAQNVDPFPEDMEVAKWVREIAEPQEIVDKKKLIFINDTKWVVPENREEKEAIEEDIDDIIITITEKTDNTTADEEQSQEEKEEEEKHAKSGEEGEEGEEGDDMPDIDIIIT